MKFEVGQTFFLLDNEHRPSGIWDLSGVQVRLVKQLTEFPFVGEYAQYINDAGCQGEIWACEIISHTHLTDIQRAGPIDTRAFYIPQADEFPGGTVAEYADWVMSRVHTLRGVTPIEEKFVDSMWPESRTEQLEADLVSTELHDAIDAWQTGRPNLSSMPETDGDTTVSDMDTIHACLLAATKHGLEVEVVYFALKAAHEGSSVSDAINYGLNEWVK